jgi:hypothetical protein
MYVERIPTKQCFDVQAALGDDALFSTLKPAVEACAPCYLFGAMMRSISNGENDYQA